MKSTLGLILAGGRVNELAALTMYRPKSAMPFGGMFRVIDCALTNMSTSGINRLGILSQYRPYSLMDHVRDGKYWDFRSYDKSVHFLPPHSGETDADWYKGTADALYQNYGFIEQHQYPLTLIVSGDHIYRMNYEVLFDIHRQTNADLTMAVTPVPKETAHLFGVAKVNKDGLVEEYREKPVEYFSNLASMTVYLFNTNVLIDELKKNAKTGKTFQIYDEIIPELVKKRRVSAYIHSGYWSYSRSFESYYQANLDCLDPSEKIDLTAWKLFTNYDIGRIGDHPPIQTGACANIDNSVISAGCVIEGTVKNSVLSPMVVVGKGSDVIDSVLMEGVTVGENSSIQRSIIDKHVSIGNGVRIGGQKPVDKNLKANTTNPDLLHCGLTIIGKRAQITNKMTIGTNVMIYPGVRTEIFKELIIADGMTIFREE